jgi:MFS family permease
MADNIEHVISYWVIFQKFHSPTLGGFAIVSHWLPFLLLSVYTGALADRYDPRRIIQIGIALFMGGGTTDARMRCAQGGATQIMAMQGTYSPESYQMVMSTSLEGAPEPAGGMTMRMRVEARRVGECRPNQE